MRKRIFLIAIILITSIALSFGIGFGIWTIVGQNHGSSEGDIEGYTIIDLDNISDSTPAFYYNEAGFFDEQTQEYSYNTTFTISINATQKDEPYDLVLSLISEDNFLSSATITSSSDRNSEEGNDVIRIEQIDEDTNFEVTYTITSTESNYSSLVSYLNENKKVFLHITAETEDGAWSVDKEISLDANVQSLVEVNIPTPHLDSFTYNGQEQYCVENNPTYYELTNNTRTNAGTQTVTASLKPGYKWSDNTLSNKSIEFIINKATPVLNGAISVLYPNNRQFAVTGDLGFIEFTGNFIDSSSNDVIGDIELDNVTSLIVGDSNYNYIFTPSDSNNYNNVNGIVSVLTYATVNFMYNSSEIKEAQYVEKNGTLAQSEIPTISDSECKNHFSSLLTYNLTPHFSNWLNFDSSTNVEGDISVYPNLIQVTRTYNVTVYFKDRDNKVSAVMTNSSSALSTYSTQVYNFIEKQDNIEGSYEYDESINLSKKIQIEYTYSYYSDASTTKERYIYAFYVSPINEFYWSDLASGNNATTYNIAKTNYLIHADGDDLTIVVLCMQAEAIVSVGIDSISASSNSVTYYANMNDAFEACRNPSSSTYLRIYGQANYSSNNFSGNCLTSNQTINQYTFSLNNVTYTVPKFTKSILDYQLASDFEIKSNLSLILPYARDVGTTTYTGPVTSNNSKSTSIHSIMTIPAGKTLTVNGSLIVGGIVFGGSATSVGAHAVLINNGTINLSSNKTIVSYGYIKGTGIINMDSESTIIDVMKIYNWPGGKNGYAMYNENVFPFDCYSIHNVSCNVKINAGANYKAFTALYMNGDWQTNTNLVIVGSGGLFNLTSGYALKYVEDTTGDTSINAYTTSNQNQTQRDVVEMFGAFNDNKVSLTVMSVKLSTGTELPMPIGFMKIILKPGSYGSLTNNSYLFLPGSQLIVEEGASLTVGTSSSKPKIIFYDNNLVHRTEYDYKSSSSATPVSGLGNSYSYMKIHASIYLNNEIIEGYEAQLLVNGSLDVSNAYIAGLVITGSSTASLTLGYSSLSIGELSELIYEGGFLGLTSTATTVSKTYYIYGYLLGANNIISTTSTVFGVGSYYSYMDSNNVYGWYTSSGTISYNVNGGKESFAAIDIPISANGYTISLSDVSKTPTRNHYSFDGWYLDSDLTQLAFESVIYCSATLYAKWTPVDYNIIYDFDQLSNGNPTDGTETNNVNNPTAYNVESNLQLFVPIYGDYVFDGWYSDSSYQTKVTQINGSNIVKALSSPYTLILYGRWYASGVESYVIYFDNSDSNGATCVASDTIIDDNYDWNSYTLPDLSIYNNDYENSLYFDGWYIGNTKVTSIDSSMFTNFELSLTAVYKNKNSLAITVGGFVVQIVYYVSGYSFTVPDISRYTTLSDKTVFVRWILSNGTTTTYPTTGSNVTLTDQNTITPDIRTYVKVTVGSNEYTTVTITLTRGQGYLVNVASNITVTEFDNSTKGNDSTFYVTTGSIFAAKYTKNSGQSNGATISDSNTTLTLTTSNQNFTVGTNNVTVTVSGSSSGGGCLLPNTLVAMADGTFKEIQYILPGEMVIVFNHETGMLDVAPVTFNESEEEQFINVIHLVFDNGSNIGVIYEHGFFDLDTMRYEYIDESNYMNFVGHRFYTMDGTYTTLIDAYVQEEYTMFYSFPTYYHLNFFTDDILSMPGGIEGLFNIFEYGNNLQYDQDKMIEDINTYGLFTVEEFAPYGVTEEMFYAYGGQYLKVALGKGILTEEYLMYLIERYGKYTE